MKRRNYTLYISFYQDCDRIEERKTGLNMSEIVGYLFEVNKKVNATEIIVRVSEEN